MGFLGFGSKWTMYSDSGSGKIYDEEKAFTTAEDVIIKSVLHKNKLSQAVKGVILGGYNTRLDQLFRYSRNSDVIPIERITVSAISSSYSDLTSLEVDLLKRGLIIKVCKDYDLPYEPYEDVPNMDLPFDNVSSKGIIVPAKPDVGTEFMADILFTYFFGSSVPNFKQADLITGNITYTEKHVEHIPVPPTENEDGTFTDNPDEEVITYKDVILNTDEVLADNIEFTDINKKYFKVKIPFIKEGRFLYVNEPEETGSTPTSENPITGETTGGYPIYTIYYDRSKVTKHNGSIINRDTKVTIYRYSNGNVTIEPIDSQGVISSKEFWEYTYNRRGMWELTNNIVPSRDNHPRSVNIAESPLYEFPEEYRVEEYDEELFELLPNEIIVRKNSKLSVISAFTTGTLKNIDYRKPYSYINIDKGIAGLLDTLDGDDEKYPEEYFQCFPTIPLRDTRGWRHRMDLTANDLSKAERRMGKIVGVDISEVSKDMYESSGGSAHLMQFIYYHSFVNLNNQNVECNEFLFDYFKLLEEIQAVDYDVLMKSYQRWVEYEPDEDTKYKMPWFPPKNYIRYSGRGGNNPNYSWNMIAVTNTVTRKRTPKYFMSVNNSEVLNRIRSKYPLPYSFGKINIITYSRRYDENHIEEVSSINFSGRWGVRSWTHRGGYQEDGMKWSGDNSGVLLPIPNGLWRKSNVLVREGVGARSGHITYLAAQWNKKSGWSSFLGFAIDVFKVVMVALTIYTGFTGAIAGSIGSAAGGVAGNVLGNSLVTNLLLNFIKGKLVGFIIQIAARKLNFPYLSYIYEIFNTFSGDFSFDITNVLKLTNSFVSIFQESINQSLIGIQQSMESDSEYWDNAMSQMEKAQEELKGSGNEKILNLIYETPEKFFGRTFADTIEASFSLLESDYLHNFENFLE